MKESKSGFGAKVNKSLPNPTNSQESESEFGDKANKKFSNPTNSQESESEFGDKANKKFSNPTNSQESESEFGDFEEVAEEGAENSAESSEQPGEIVRARMPRGKELIGIIVQRYGGNRMEVKTTDGKKRNCRVPGRYKRRLWLRPNDIILIVPWVDDDTKGDIIYKYSSSGINQLKKKGILESLKEEF